MSVHSVSVKTADGAPCPLSQYAGRVLVIVNTASMCGFTAANMSALASLAAELTPDVVVLAFPCTQFGNQEPKDACAVREWALSQYGATFPILEKVKVKGPDAHPLFVLLQQAQGPIRWNFTKFVCNREGVPVARLEPSQLNGELRAAISQAMQ